VDRSGCGRHGPRIPVGAVLTFTALPLIPDGDEARTWAERELADPAYDIAEPTPIDRFARAVLDFFARLFSGGLPEAWGPWLAVGVAVLVVALLVTAVLIWGRPRARARARARSDLFDAADARTAADLRRSAEAAAARFEWDAAVAERFRALARALGERLIVDPVPGATVHAFAREASEAFPVYAEALESAAAAFDDVRYLRRPGTAELYRVVADLDDELADSRPAAAAAVTA
jgi:hypothetical protein